MDQLCCGLWQPVSAAAVMAGDGSDREPNGSADARTAAVQCSHSQILQGALGFVRAFIVVEVAGAVVFKKAQSFVR